jgi:hypothetical protein
MRPDGVEQGVALLLVSVNVVFLSQTQLQSGEKLDVMEREITCLAGSRTSRERQNM